VERGVDDLLGLSRAYAEFAELLLTDYEVADVLQRLCDHALGLLDVDGAGVSLPGSDGVRVAWASGPDAHELEDLQRDHGQGPCVDVLGAGAPLEVGYEQAAARWPLYTGHAVRLGVQRWAALPLRARDRTWGVLSLYRRQDRAFAADELAVTQVLADTATAYLVMAEDRGARRTAEDELRTQAVRDPLTGLLNRVLMFDRLRQALAGVARHPGSAGLLFLDLDRFKEINDEHGHVVGDRLLTAVARRLEHAVRPTDTLARFGGDEFLVLCQDLHHQAVDLRGIAQRLVVALAPPFRLPEVPGGEMVVRASIGAVELVDGDSPQDALHHADTAMYSAKRAGGGVVLSSRSVDSVAAAALRSDAELHRALERHELRLAFQPIVALPDQATTGLEVLLRWQHPTRGLLSAAQFVPVLERTGLIVPVGDWVLSEACRRLPELLPSGASDTWFLAVNVSVQQLQAPDFVDKVALVLATTAIEPRRLLLEVTETALVPGGQTLHGPLLDVADLGVRVALDDFGTGFSSLTHLKDLPAQVLKIDKSFVGGLGLDRRDDAVVRGTIALAHDLGLSVIAEGIEHPRQHAHLVAAGCDAAQGYLYGHPA
jgi:diguanylate cyclase (GGDEF)-like protein